MKYLKLYENFEDIELVISHNIEDFKPLFVLNKDHGDYFQYYMEEWCKNSDIRRELEENGNWVNYLIKYQNKYVGTIGEYQLKYNGEFHEGEYWLGFFGVLEEYRGSGVSYRALTNLLEMITKRDIKFHKMMLYTEKINYHAQNFYRRMGFNFLSEGINDYCKINGCDKEEYFNSPTEDIIMYKNIKTH